MTPATQALPLAKLPHRSLSGVRYIKLKGHVTTFAPVLRGTSNLVEVILLPFLEGSLDWHICFTYLARTSAGTLTCLAGEATCFLDFRSAFIPLAVAPNIRTLKVSTQRGGFVWLRDRDILSIATMWPRLECFLTPTHRRLVFSGITLLGIEYLLKLKHLCVVELQVADETVVWPRRTSSTDGFAQKHLHHLMSDFRMEE
ncbi:hypothetical protein NLJ89_g11808 [Agrocybe chaxingu]|uniref:Uncharacterized protein n=1 Tax=Agrocybe chaxingu TaxID=84603 RepID=A0A9W8JN25_9AGAR|nr:hypothetical protein NLJ89_g11808 [Agrocybe chaxingu]